MTRRSLAEIKTHALAALKAYPGIAARASRDCAWLEAVQYPGLKLLLEALADHEKTARLEADALGLDLQGVSCVFLADDIQKLTRERGRLFLRNVRHGLYLLPDSVTGNYAIGCPVDPGFALGGERMKNPYAEKLERAASDGIDVDDALWQSLASLN